MLDDPVRQRALKADVMSGFFRLDPLVFQNLLALGLELAVERRVFQQVARLKGIFGLIRHTTKIQFHRTLRPPRFRDNSIFIGETPERSPGEPAGRKATLAGQGNSPGATCKS